MRHGTRKWLVLSVATSVAAALLVVGGAERSDALSVTYEHEGGFFQRRQIVKVKRPKGNYTTAMNVTGSITLDLGEGVEVISTLGLFASVADLVTAYSFSDGRSTLTQDNSTLIAAAVQVPLFDGTLISTGNIVRWNFVVQQGNPHRKGKRFRRIESIKAAVDGGGLLTRDRGIIGRCTRVIHFNGPAGPASTCVVRADVGQANDQPGGWQAVVPAAATSVPEPRLALLAGVAFVALALRLRRR